MFTFAQTLDADGGEMLFCRRKNNNNKLYYEAGPMLELIRQVHSLVIEEENENENEDEEKVFIVLYFSHLSLLENVLYRRKFDTSIVAQIQFSLESFNLSLVVDGYVEEDNELASIHLNSKNNISLSDISVVLGQLFRTLLQIRLNHTGMGNIIAQPDEIKEATSCISTHCFHCQRATILYRRSINKKKTYGCLFCYEYLFENKELKPEIGDMSWGTEYFIEHEAEFNDFLYET